MEQESELAKSLKNILDNMSQDEFDKEWTKVVSLNLESPSLHEIKDFLIEKSN